jgi:hypothetical protein
LSQHVAELLCAHRSLLAIREAMPARRLHCVTHRDHRGHWRAGSADFSAVGSTTLSTPASARQERRKLADGKLIINDEGNRNSNGSIEEDEYVPHSC